MQDKNSTAAFFTQPSLPSDRETERSVLGTIINNDGYFSNVEDILDSNAFYDSKFKAIFRCVKYLLLNGKVVDGNAILEIAKRNEKDFGFEITDLDILEAASCDSKNTFLQDVERIVDYGQRRRAWETLVKASQRILSLGEGADETITEVIKSLDEIRGLATTDSGTIDAKEALRMVYNQINDNLAGINKASVRTGFHFSDDKGGLRLGAFVVIGAWTGVGKTSLAMNIAVNAARMGVPSAYYSLEMSASELWARILNTETGVPAWKIQGYALNRDEMHLIDEAQERLINLPIYIDDKATTSFEKMLRSVRYMVKTRGIKIFFVDYLQIFSQNMKGEREEAVLAYMARECRNLCRELNIVCIALSQLHRAKEVKHPAFDMLRGSGQIEESADNIILIDRPEAHPEWGVSDFQFCKEKDVHNRAELRVVKGRNIGTGAFFVGYEPTKFLFYEEDGFTEANNETRQENNVPFEMATADDHPF